MDPAIAVAVAVAVSGAEAAASAAAMAIAPGGNTPSRFGSIRGGTQPALLVPSPVPAPVSPPPPPPPLLLLPPPPSEFRAPAAAADPPPPPNSPLMNAMASCDMTCHSAASAAW